MSAEGNESEGRENRDKNSGKEKISARAKDGLPGNGALAGAPADAGNTDPDLAVAKEKREGEYTFEDRELAMVQITRRCRFSYEEAREFLEANGCPMGKNKWFAAKKYIKENISERIQRIAMFEYADMHLQLLDKSLDMFARLEAMAHECQADEDRKGELKVYEETRQAIGLIKELYNSNTIVGGVEKLVKEHMRDKLSKKDMR